VRRGHGDVTRPVEQRERWFFAKSVFLSPAPVCSALHRGSGRSTLAGGELNVADLHRNLTEKEVRATDQD
jgi:hypothetical protein